MVAGIKLMNRILRAITAMKLTRWSTECFARLRTRSAVRRSAPSGSAISPPSSRVSSRSRGPRVTTGWLWSITRSRPRDQVGILAWLLHSECNFYEMTDNICSKMYIFCALLVSYERMLTLPFTGSKMSGQMDMLPSKYIKVRYFWPKSAKKSFCVWRV